MEGDGYKKRVKFITMEEFVQREGGPDGQFPLPTENLSDIVAASKVCVNGGHNANCKVIEEYLTHHATVPNITATHHECLVFDKGMYEKGVPDDPESAKEFCASGNRKMVYVTPQMQEPQLLYIQGNKPPTRMLAHYYGYLHFTDVSIGNYYKRYVRGEFHLHLSSLLSCVCTCADPFCCVPSLLQITFIYDERYSALQGKSLNSSKMPRKNRDFQ